MTLYMAVTADEYELPLLVEENLGEFAQKLGKRKRTVIDELNRIKRGKGHYNGSNCGYRMVKVVVEDKDEMEALERFHDARDKWMAGEITAKYAAQMCGMPTSTFMYRAKKFLNGG